MLAKFGTPEWKPISETRKATLIKLAEEQPDTSYIALKWGYRCVGCNYPMHLGRRVAWCGDLANAIEQIEFHNSRHYMDLAECCMYATVPVCECGNVIV